MGLFYVTLFFTFSFIGCVLDSGYKSLLRHRLIVAGYLYPIPICPIYGMGALALVAVFKIFAMYSPFVQIAIGGVSAVLVEFIAGLLCMYVLKAQLWNYHNIPGNILGVINPFHSIGWLFITTLFYCAIYPAIVFFENYLNVPRIFSTGDAVVVIAAVATIAIATWIKYKKGPKNYCILPGYNKRH